MVKFGRVLQARLHGRRVFGGVLVCLANRYDKWSLLMLFWGDVEAVWDARWQLFRHIGTRRPFALRRFMKHLHTPVCALLPSLRHPP